MIKWKVNGGKFQVRVIFDDTDAFWVDLKYHIIKSAGEDPDTYVPTDTWLSDKIEEQNRWPTILARIQGVECSHALKAEQNVQKQIDDLEEIKLKKAQRE